MLQGHNKGKSSPSYFINNKTIYKLLLFYIFMGLVTDKRFFTEYSNKYLLLNEFTNIYIKFNTDLSEFKVELMARGISNYSIKKLLDLLSSYFKMNNYLKLFLKEEVVKRKNKKDLEDLYNQLLKLEEELYKLFLNLKKTNDKKKAFFLIDKEIMKKFKSFQDLVELINPKIGLFSEKVITASTRKEEDFSKLMEVN